MLATLLAERRAIACTLSPLAVACVLAGYVAWSSHEPSSSIRAPALAFYVPPAGLVPGMASPSVMAPMRAPEQGMPAAPLAPMATPSAVMPAMVDATAAQMPGQPSLDTSNPQTLPQAVAVSEKVAFMGPLQIVFLAMAASVAVGVAMTRKRTSDHLQNTLRNDVEDSLSHLGAGILRPAMTIDMEDRLELGMHPGRAGVPAMMAKAKSLPFMESPAHLEGMVGNAGFDPLGLSTPQNIKWMREAELKHGRACMLAWTGYVAVDLGLRFPGEKYANLTSFTAHDATQYELFLLLLWVGTFETIGFKQIYGMMDGTDDRDAGDFGFDPLGLLPGNEEKYKLAELTHGRAAMLAFSAVVTQSALPQGFGFGSETFPYA